MWWQHETPTGACRGVSSSMGGVAPPSRCRNGAAAAAQAEGREELFSLESSGPPAFAALIRLTPDLVDEFRRAVEVGGGICIMFNSNINPAENVTEGACLSSAYTRSIEGVGQERLQYGCEELPPSSIIISQEE